jgi:hypothetical protein
MSDGKDDGGAVPGRRRRSWTLDEKRRIIDESLEDGSSKPKRAPDARDGSLTI